MLCKIILVFFVLVISYMKCSDENFKQERAKLLYYNPKYMENVSILTVRKDRHSPYRTTIKATTLYTIGNNVSWGFEFSTAKISAFPLKVEFKSCDGVARLGWLKEWLEMYSNIPIRNCPVIAGEYYLRDLEFPPKNFPLQFNNADYSGKIFIFATATKERIAEISFVLKTSK